ncbi:MAG: SsrA-binding protein SmpB [Candidatus Kaiserbacteria bacterium]|nr:SsrA-binding protein SmpB [Candidatus Kaiserbacteria bacterium]
MVYITNKQVKRQYEILKTYRAGLSLLGTETKSIRTGKGSLVGATVLVRGGEAFLVNATIPAHQEKNAPSGYDPDRTRKLLLTKPEVRELHTALEKKGLTLVPMEIYNSRRKLKLGFAIARKKNPRDKREDLKRRDADRDRRRSLQDDRYD